MATLANRLRVVSFLLCICVLAALDGDPYKILGVKRTASQKEIKQAYRAKAKETHPDKVRH